MSESFANKNIQKISYIAPLDIAQLFTKDRLHSTINYIFGTFVDMVLEGKSEGYEIEEPIVYNSAHNIFLVEYTFLFKCLSELVDNKDLFKAHYKIDFDDKKMLLF